MAPTSRSAAHSPFPWKIMVALMTVLLLTLGLAACGGEETDPDGGEAAAGGSGLPVSIEHKYGTTEIKSPPERVVTVGMTDQDAVLALGIKPVGVVEFSGLGLGVTEYPWSARQWGGTRPTVVGQREDFKFEQIAALRPDLIIGLYTGMTKADYDKLSKIAPTVAQSADHPDYAMPWQDMTLVT